MEIIKENGLITTKFKGGGSVVQNDIAESSDNTEKWWRDSELIRTDGMLQPDRTAPSYQEILDYRVKLKEYPQQPDFPNGTRPII